MKKVILKTTTVTPCVGVWIEIAGLFVTELPLIVTPCVGVWIEIIPDRVKIAT